MRCRGVGKPLRLTRFTPAAVSAGVPLAAELAAAVAGRPLEQFSHLEALPALAALLMRKDPPLPLLPDLDCARFGELFSASSIP